MNRNAIHFIFFLLISCAGLKNFGQYPVLKDLKKLGFEIEHIKEVKNIKEFIQALGSNTVIIVDTGTYVFTDSYILGSEEEKSKLDRFDTLSEYYSDTYIHDIENLIILGSETLPPLFVQPDGYNHVLKFRNVRNLYMQNLRLGHEVSGYCMGGVLLIHNGEHVLLDQLELFGSGTEGLSLIDVENITISNTVITKCSEQLSTFSNVHNAILENCRFVENDPELRGFAVFKSTIIFKNSLIQEKYPFYEDPHMYDNDYNVLFVIDDYDFGEWYIDRSGSDSLPGDLSGSEITLSNTTINDELVNCIYQNVEEYYEEEYYEEDGYYGEDYYEEGYYQEDYNDEYYFENSYFIDDVTRKHILVKDITISFMGPPYWTNTWYEEYSKDTINIPLEPGEDPQGKVLRIMKSDLLKVKKIEQQYETSIAINTGDFFMTVSNWKHYTSPWSRLPAIAPCEYESPAYTTDELTRFPSYSKNELIDYLVLHGFEQAAIIIQEQPDGSDDNNSIILSRITYKITGIDKNNQKVIRIINFRMPTGY